MHILSYAIFIFLEIILKENNFLHVIGSVVYNKLAFSYLDVLT